MTTFTTLLDCEVGDRLLSLDVTAEVTPDGYVLLSATDEHGRDFVAKLGRDVLDAVDSRYSDSLEAA